MEDSADDLAAIELAAHEASAPLLRYYIRQVERLVARDPAGCGEHGQILLLKLHHLLTQQQVLAAQSAGAGAYLAPNLVIGERRAGPSPARQARATRSRGADGRFLRATHR